MQARASQNSLWGGLAVAALLGGLLLWLLAPGPAAAGPNVIVILADDLGYADIGLHGGDITTPHIDSIAARGVQFTNAYASHASCSPSRAGLLTGRHQMRFGFIDNPDRVRPTRPGNSLGLPPSEITLAEVLGDAGYRTAAIGKWHLGLAQELHPLEQGFDEFFGFLGSLHPYFPLGPGEILRGRRSVEERDYLTDAFTREAADFIERNRKRPFFLYLAYNAVHTPLMGDTPPAKGETITLYGTGDAARDRATYRNMVQALDAGVGRILATLRRLGIENDTLLMFVSDNGGARITGAYDNSPLRDFKGTLYEGGIRVPFLLQWPAGVGAGTRYDHPVSVLDILPTAAGAARAALPGNRVIDGVDLAPYLRGERAGAPHQALYWNWGPHEYAVRQGEWKLIRRGGQSIELYNLSRDIAETRNRSAAKPHRVRELDALLTRWIGELDEPLWEPDPDQAGVP